MTSDKKKIVVSAVATLAILIYSIVGHFAQQRHDQYLAELEVPGLGQASDSTTSVSISTKELTGFQFWTIWNKRHHHNIGPELVPFLSASDSQLRILALHAFSVLESADGIKPIAQQIKILEKSGGNKRNVSLLHRLTLARIQARRLHGKAKVEAILRAVDLSWPEIVTISKRINTTLRGPQEMGTPAYAIIEFIVDVMYDMKRRGENIDSLSQQILLNRPQQLMLQGASVPVDEEVRMIFDYTLHSYSGDADDSRLIELHFLFLDSGISRLAKKMREILSNANQYSSPQFKAGINGLFKAALATEDRQFIPILRDFETKFHGYVADRAAARRHILEGLQEPLGPK